MQERLGLNHFHMYMDLGGMDHREVIRSMERFATGVIRISTETEPRATARQRHAIASVQAP